MALLTLLFRAILFLFAIRLAGIVLRTFMGGLMQGTRPGEPSSGARGSNPRTNSGPPGQIEELVKDPVCGVHIARSTAIAGRYQGSPAYFCSEDCAAKAS